MTLLQVAELLEKLGGYSPYHEKLTSGSRMKLKHAAAECRRV